MKDKLARGAGWLAASRVLVNVLGFASTLLLARLLVPGDFGLVAIATAIGTIAAAVTELSLSSALIQHHDPQDFHYDTMWTLGVMRSVLLGALMAAMAWPVAMIYGDRRLLGVMLALAALNAIGGLGNPRLVIFQRELVFWQDFAMSVSSKMIGFVAGVAIAYVFRSYWALVAGMVASQLCGLALSYALKPTWPRFSLRDIRQLLGYSVWISLSQIVRQLGWKSDQFLIGYAFGSTQLGLYTYGDNLASLPTREATAPIAGTLFPAFSRMASERHRLRRAYEQSQMMLFAVALPIGVGFALIAKPLVWLVLGAKWVAVIFVIQVLASVFAGHSLTGAAYPLAMALGETRQLLKRDIWILLIGLVLIVGGVLSGGITGVIWSRVIGSVIGTGIDMALVRSLIDIPIRRQLSANVRASLAVLGMAASVMYCQSFFVSSADHVLAIEVTISVLVGTISYSTFSYCIWLIVKRPDGPERQLIKLLWVSIIFLRSRFTQNVSKHKFDDLP